MATGRDIQLTRQIGEYLAAAELGRRGWVATTFTGSLPGFDILAVNTDGQTLEVQVKAIRSKSWQLKAGPKAHRALQEQLGRHTVNVSNQAPQRRRSAFGFRTRSASLTLWGGRARPASSAPVTELGR